ncbi:MAG: zinc finger domain-containing protein [Candidatus Woesearchaeota archaeon]
MQVKFDNNQKLINEPAHITFKCPMCDAEISRSREARILGKKYTCSGCGFVGP